MPPVEKVAVVTGASQGLGAAIVAAFRARNYRVVATSRTIGPTDDPGLRTVRGDIGDPLTGPRVIDEALRCFGRVDTLVNNAGIALRGPFGDSTDDDYRRMVATNLGGFFHTTHAAIGAMERQKSGHVVQITSTLAERGSTRAPTVLVALTKGGLDAATRSLAIEYAARGIRVNALSLGVVKTPMHPAEQHDALATLHPLGRMGEIDDVVRGLLYLEDATFVTGEILHVDGGQSAGS